MVDITWIVVFQLGCLYGPVLCFFSGQSCQQLGGVGGQHDRPTFFFFFPSTNFDGGTRETNREIGTFVPRVAVTATDIGRGYQ